jgi:hypothetical protein
MQIDYQGGWYQGVSMLRLMLVDKILFSNVYWCVFVWREHRFGEMAKICGQESFYDQVVAIMYRFSVGTSPILISILVINA